MAIYMSDGTLVEAQVNDDGEVGVYTGSDGEEAFTLDAEMATRLGVALIQQASVAAAT